jgi:RNA polymerase sigma factor (sigma-70 family)
VNDALQGRPQPARSDGRWLSRVHALAVELATTRDPRARHAVRAELWPLLLSALMLLVRRHARRFAAPDPDTVHDLAAEKALDVLVRLERDDYTPQAYGPSQLGAFLTTIAKNAVTDHFRARQRFARELPLCGASGPAVPAESADAAMLRRQFVVALEDCTRKLQPRARRIWFFRALLDLPSKTIARHPDIAMSPAAVDMVLARCRRSLRICMRRRGFEAADMPPGTFVSLWQRLGRKED